MKKRTIALLMAAVMLFGATIGGTLAWLVDTTGKVTNTFTEGKVDIDLYETEEGSSTHINAKEYQLIPGTEHFKNPTVEVVRANTNVDCWLFVKFVEGAKNNTYLTYTSNLTEANGWKPVTGETNVWYREVKATDTEISWELLEGNKVTVNGDAVTKGTMADAVANTKLEYTAFAVQKDNLTVDQAWAKVKPAN